MNDILGLSDILGDDISGEEAAAILGELLEGEDLSGEDLSGEDAAAILGAALRGKGQGKKMLQKAIMARKLGSAQVISPRKPSSSGVQPIGFESLGVAATTQVVVTTQPQTWFKPMRLVIPGSIAPFFTVNNIIIGNKSQFPSPIAIPGETFIPEAQAVVMDLDTVNPALNLTLVVTNISGVPQNFRATFVGKEVTP
jgi:hypothetical protein